MIDGKSAGFISSGAVFGEVALLYACARTASVVARSAATLWRMHRDLFRALQAEHAARELDARKAAFASVPSLQALTEAQITSIAAAAQEMHFAPSKRVIARGDAGDRFFVIRSGTALVQGGLAPVVHVCARKDTSAVKDEAEGESEEGADAISTDAGVSYFDEGGTDTSVTLRAGDFFGERALLMNERRSADVYAHPDETQDLVCLTLGRRHFEKVCCVFVLSYVSCTTHAILCRLSFAYRFLVLCATCRHWHVLVRRSLLRRFCASCVYQTGSATNYCTA